MPGGAVIGAAVHQIRHRRALEAQRRCGLVARLRGGGGQEDADENLPSAAKRVPREELNEPQSHQKPAEARAEHGRDAGRAPQVSSAPPDDRAQHAPAVERKRWNEVEQRQHRIGEREKCENGGDPAPAGRLRANPARETGRGDCDAGDGADNGHPEFRARGRGLLPKLRHAAENEECDAANLQAEAARHNRMGQLVQHDGEEQPRCPNDPHCDISPQSQMRDFRREIAGAERQHEVEGKEEPRDVYADAEAQQRK